MQQLNPSEISDIIKQRIRQLDVASQATNEGTIVSVTDGIIRIHGLAEVHVRRDDRVRGRCLRYGT